MAHIYAHLKKEGFSVTCLNLCHEPNGNVRESLERAFAKRRLDVVCSGGMSVSWKRVEEVFATAKAVSPGVTTVAGGPIVTADPETALRHLTVDYGVAGEGEHTIVELLTTIQKNGPLEGVKGVAFLEPDGKFVFTGTRKEIGDLDSLSTPEYEAFGFRQWMGTLKYAGENTLLETWDELRYAEVVGSRSCPFSCTFCYHPLGKIYRKRSLDHVFKEVDYLVNVFGVNAIQFTDELFSATNKQMLDFAERIRPYKIKWMCQFRVSRIQRDVLEKLVEAGLFYAGMGIESMNDAVLKSMKKKTTRAEIVFALDTARKAGLFFSGNIILGDPADTIETMNDSIKWWRDNPQFHVSMGLILAVPDAPVYRFALKEGLIKDAWEHASNGFPLVNLTKLSNREYYNLALKIQYWNLMLTRATPGTLIGSKKLDERYNGKSFYQLEMRCPFCACEQKYKKFKANDNPNVLIICVKCFASFKIPQKTAFYDDYSAFRTYRHVFSSLRKRYIQRFKFGRTNFAGLKKFFKSLLPSGKRRTQGERVFP